jgi:molybdate transport system substrate-binding protein
VFLRNRLALLAPHGTSADPSALPAGAKIAVAGPEVPAGRIWREYLSAKGLLGELEPRFANADNVRAVLGLFEAGAADYALVYATDARAARREHATWVPEDGPPVEYVAAAVGTPSADARAYLDWLHSDAFAAVARDLGFDPVPSR